MKSGKPQRLQPAAFLLAFNLFFLILFFISGSPAWAAIYEVDMGNQDPPCGSFNTSDIGFVDCTSNTGGILVAAMTTILTGDTVQWTMRSTPHTTTSEAGLTGGPAAACATGDNWDSGVANAFTPGFVFTHTFSTPGTCAYFCIIHPTTMQGQVNVLGPGQTTTTTLPGQTTTTTSTTTTTIPGGGATFDVDMGNMDPPCGSFNTSDIGFVDCNTTGTGGILVTAMTDIFPGDTVRWTMRSTPHTVTSEAGLTGGPNAACGTGDNFDSGVANAFTPGFVFEHTFITPGTCNYFCIIHPTTMQGQVNVLGPGQTTTTLAPTTTTTSTTIRGQTTTTTSTTTTTLPSGPAYNVDMGDMTAPCGGAGPNDIGFVDCDTTGTGGILVTAMTDIFPGDTVRWTMRSTPHTVTTEAGLTGGPNAACGTGDNFDSGVSNAFTPGFVFTHTFSTPGTCAYFCIIHPTTMQGQVNVLGPGQTTTTIPSTTTTTNTTIPGQTTTTTTRPTTTTTTLPSGPGYDVDMGNMDPPCGSFNASDIGFVDCNTTGTGGILVTAMTNISAGDTVRWTMRSTPHTATTEAGLTGGPNAACGTGDNFDSGVSNAFTPGFVFTHTFITPGACNYYCIIHPTTMQGQVNVLAAGPTTTTTTIPGQTTTTTTRSTTTTTIPGQPGFNVNVLVDSFSPADITITPGDTVTWHTQSVSAGIHTVTGDPTAPYGPDSQCQESLQPPGQFLDTVGQTYAHQFLLPGLCHYVCLIHQVSTGMIGTVNVVAAAITTTTTTTTTRPSTTTTTSTTRPGQTTTTTITVTTTTFFTTTTTTLSGQTTTTTTSTTLPGQTTTTTTTQAAVTTTTVAATTTTTQPAVTTTVATTTTTRPATPTTTTTTRSTLPDVGIKQIDAPSKVDAGKSKTVKVKVKNYSNTTQTRNVSLFLNGVNTGIGQSVTLEGGKETNVEFDVYFGTPGTATLEASLLPGDSNPSNDTATTTVVVKN